MVARLEAEGLRAQKEKAPRGCYASRGKLRIYATKRLFPRR
jgi:hypothetical protein